MRGRPSYIPLRIARSAQNSSVKPLSPTQLVSTGIMAIPNEALQKLVQEIESQALVAQQQIGLARTQMTAKQREQRLVRLTISEMATLPDDAVVYEGVGKMFVSLPVDSLRKKLDSQTQNIETEVDKLSKRLLYLETTQKNSRNHIEQMLGAK